MAGNGSGSDPDENEVTGTYQVTVKKAETLQQLADYLHWAPKTIDWVEHHDNLTASSKLSKGQQVTRPRWASGADDSGGGGGDKDGGGGDKDGGGTTTTTVEKLRQRWRGRTVPYGQAQQQPANAPNNAAAFSTGPGEAVEYHYERVPTYHQQYADQVAAQQGAENNPT